MVVLLSVGEAMLDQSARRLAGRRRASDRAAAGDRRRGDADRRPRRDVLRHRSGPLPHAPGASAAPASRGSFGPSRPRSRGSCSTCAAHAARAEPIAGARRRRDPEPGRARSGPGSTSARALGRTRRPTPPTWRPRPSSSTTSSTAFHLPRGPDSTWGEWHYFNLVDRPRRVVVHHLSGRGRLSRDPGRRRWGGRLLVTHRRPDGRYDRFTADVPAAGGPPRHRRAPTSPSATSTVRQRDGIYHLQARAAGRRRSAPARPRPAAAAQIATSLRSSSRDDAFLSGYVVPALAAAASGPDLRRGPAAPWSRDAPAYHDHNWGVWRDVTWEWGAARGARSACSTAASTAPTRRGADAVTSPSFSPWSIPSACGRCSASAASTTRAPAGRRRARCHRRPRGSPWSAPAGADSVTLRSDVAHALATEMSAASFRRLFFQMRGDGSPCAGALAAAAVSDEGRDSSRPIARARLPFP